MNTLDGYFGGGGHRRHSCYTKRFIVKAASREITATPKSAFKQKPPVSVGLRRKRGGGTDFSLDWGGE